MTARLFILGLFWLAECGTTDAAAARPNVLLILADDMGFSDIGCHGGEIPTPNIDSLAKGGLRFTQFYNAARCSPTRAALLTGLQQHQAGMGMLAEDPGQTAAADAPAGYIRRLNRECVTLAEVLQAAGYFTCMAGKWHLGHHRQEYWPRQRGFERFHGIVAGACSYLNPHGNRGLVDGNTRLPAPDRADYYTTDDFADHLVRYLGEARDRPFFAYLAFNAPHWPLHARPEDVAKFEGRYQAGWDALRAERWQRQVDAGLVRKEWGLPPRDAGARAWDSLDAAARSQLAHRMAVYAAQVHRMDFQIGRVLSTLREQGRLDDTLVLFLSDNGACAEPYTDLGGGPVEKVNDPAEWGAISYGTGWANASNTPFRRFKSTLNEGGISTPLIVHWPAGLKTKPGSFTDTRGYLTDIFPTVLAVTGVAYPSEFGGHRIKPLEGRSLAPVLAGDTLPQPEWMFWEHYGDRAARKGDWKALGRIGSDTWELYDMATDRTELHDVAAEKPELVRELADAWQLWAASHQVLPRPQSGKR